MKIGAGTSHPNRHLHAAGWDMALALAAAGMHYDLFALEHPGWDMVPAWIWPALMLVFLFSALWSYGRHRRRRAGGR